MKPTDSPAFPLMLPTNDARTVPTSDVVTIARELVTYRVLLNASPVTVSALVREYAPGFADVETTYEAFMTDADLAALAAADGRSTWDERDVIAILADPSLAASGMVQNAPGRPVSLSPRGADEVLARQLPGADVAAAA